jgi:hypothetical protein
MFLWEEKKTYNKIHFSNVTIKKQFYFYYNKSLLCQIIQKWKLLFKDSKNIFLIFLALTQVHKSLNYFVISNPNKTKQTMIVKRYFFLF